MNIPITDQAYSISEKNSKIHDKHDFTLANLQVQLLFYSFLSGCLACIVSVCMKLAFADLTLITNSDSILIYSIRLISIAFSILSNIFMWIFYSKSLQLSTNSLVPTALNKLCNFICSAVFGYFLFSENINLNWFIGIVFLTVGILILNSSTAVSIKDAAKRE